MTARPAARALPTLALGLGLLMGCGAGTELSQLSWSGERVTPVVLYGAHFEGFSGGARDVSVFAARAQLEPRARVARLSRVRIEFDDAHQGRVEIRADRGSLELDSEDFVLAGNVTGRLGRGERFRTEQVRYESAAERVTGAHPVELERPGLLLTGSGLEIDLATQRLRIRGPVSTRVRGAEGEAG